MFASSEHLVEEHAKKFNYSNSWWRYSREGIVEMTNYSMEINKIGLVFLINGRAHVPDRTTRATNEKYLGSNRSQ